MEGICYINVTQFLMNIAQIVCQKQYRIYHQEPFCVIYHLFSVPSVVMKAKCWKACGLGDLEPSGEDAFSVLNTWISTAHPLPPQTVLTLRGKAEW